MGIIQVMDRIFSGSRTEWTFICAVVVAVTAMNTRPGEEDVSVVQSSKTNGIPSESKIGEWVYGYREDNGPREWPFRFRFCGGKRQSPIDLDTTASVMKTHPRLHWWNYNLKPERMRLRNNGHTASLKGFWSDFAAIPSFWSSEGNESYIFDHLHFHWGSNSSSGSEHTINSLSYSLEIHAVYHKQRFNNLKEALDSGDNNVVVVAVLYGVSEHENKALTPIISALKSVRHAGAEVEVRPFELRLLLPEFSKRFLMYNGSLTSPPCTESVLWVVMLQPSTVSKKQIAEFRLLRTERDESILDNRRPTQPLNGRSVWQIK